MKPQRQSYKRTLSCSHSLGRRFYKGSQEEGKNSDGQTCQKVSCLMCMLSVWLGRTNKGVGRPGRQLKHWMMKAKLAVQCYLQ